MVKKLLYLLVVISLLIPIIGCHETSSSTSTSTSTTTSTTGTTTTDSPPPVTTNTPAVYPLDFKLKLSKIPQPGETAELTLDVSPMDLFLLSSDKPKEGLANSKVWLDFTWVNLEGSYSDAKHGVSVPLSEVLVSGKTDIQGDVREQESLHCTIKLPREGIWIIRGNVLGEGWASPETITKMYAIADGYAIGYGFTPNPELASSPLAYLMYFPYGQIGYYTLNEMYNPIIQEIDISEAPKTGESATITVKITSLHDIYGFSSDIRFFHNDKHEVVPGKSLYLNGDLSWSGDLKANEPVLYSVNIKFPEEGEWKIGTVGITESDPRMFQDRIELTIGDGRSFYGWKPLPKIESSGPDPNQAALNLDTGETVFPYKTDTTQPAQSAPSTSPSPQSTPFNWIPIIIAISAVCVIGGVLSYLLIIRRHGRK